MTWIKRNIWEIERSPALMALGALISIGHIITYFYWISASQLFSSENAKPLLCWEFFPQCGTALHFSGRIAGWAFTAFLAFSCLSLLIFLMRRMTGLAWFFTMLSWVIAFGTYSLDASLRSNAHSYFILLTFGFLFLPNKGKLVKGLTLLFYLMDAYTKMNPEWLSGLPIVGLLPVPNKGLEWIAAFTVLIELTMPFFLLSRDGQRIGYGLGALILTHAFYFFVQHDAGSLILVFILLFFLFLHFEQKRLERESMYQSYEHPEPSNLWWPVLFLVFILSQFHMSAHRFPLGVLQLHKPQMAEDCRLFAFAHFKSQVKVLDHIVPAGLSEGLRCHPSVNFNALKGYCKDQAATPDFQNVTAFFLTRSLSEITYTLRFSSDRFCDGSFNPMQSRGRDQ